MINYLTETSVLIHYEFYDKNIHFNLFERNIMCLYEYFYYVWDVRLIL